MEAIVSIRGRLKRSIERVVEKEVNETVVRNRQEQYRKVIGVSPQLHGFVCAIHPATPGSSPKHTIYAFINLIKCKKTKINKKRPSLALFEKGKQDQTQDYGNNCMEQRQVEKLYSLGVLVRALAYLLSIKSQVIKSRPRHSAKKDFDVEDVYRSLQSNNTLN